MEKNFLEGLPTKQFRHLQQRHYNEIESSRTGRKWMAGLIKKLVALGQEMWQHRNDIKH